MNRTKPTIPLASMTPGLPSPASVRNDPAWSIPSDAQCQAHWDRFAMPDHIREHSRQVARVATFLAEAGQAKGLAVCAATVRASALLHDLAKAYCITHGGNHSQLGAAWAMALTRNPVLAQGVVHHVYWPFEVDAARYFMPMAVLYADKRVSHDRIVPIEERFEDLLTRYGSTSEIRERILTTNRQAKDIEQALERLLEIDLNAHAFDCGRLVE